MELSQGVAFERPAGQRAAQERPVKDCPYDAFGPTLGLYRDNGKEHGNYHSI